MKRGQCASVVIALVLGAAAAKAVGQSTYTAVALGLTGAPYTVPYYSGFYVQTGVSAMNDRGMAVGGTSRYGNSIYTYDGSDAWLYDGTQTRQIGPASTGGAYETALMINHAGLIVGTTSYPLGTGFSSGFGSHTWIYDGTTTQTIGPTGSVYSYLGSVGSVENTKPVQLNSAGQIIGTSARYGAAGNSLGADAWLYSGGSTQLIGLTGAGYTYTASNGVYQSNTVVQLNEAGQTIGNASRFDGSGNSLGQDAWLRNSSGATRVLGLSGANYQYTPAASTSVIRSSTAYLLTAGGAVLGSSLRYGAGGQSLGNDSWSYSGGSTTRISPTGVDYGYTPAGAGGTYQSSNVWQFTASGQALGSSYRYNAAGQIIGDDAWRYSGGALQHFGLAGAPYDYNVAGTGGTHYQYNIPQGMNAGGQVIGYTTRYTASGTPVGQDSWLGDSSGTRQIGPIGTGYSYTDSANLTRQSTMPDLLNTAGDVVGTAMRYDPDGAQRGQAVWFYDHSTGVSTPLIFATDTFGDSQATPTYLTNSGAVLGTYERYNGLTDIGGSAFYWSETAGFHDLGSLIIGTPTWQNLNVYDNAAERADGLLNLNGDPSTLLAIGWATGETGGDTVFLLTQTPEPTLLPIAIGCAALTLRRRRRQLCPA